MILEQLAQDVSNRPFFGADDSIREAIFLVSQAEIAQAPLLSAPEKEFPHSPKSPKSLVSKVLKKDKGTRQKTLEPKKNKAAGSLDEVQKLKELYGLLEEQNVHQIDYSKLFSYLERRTSLSSEYQLEQETSKQKNSLMSDTEAKETVQKIQLSYLTGNKGTIPYEEKEKFHHWQQFNKALLMLYHRLSLVPTEEIDYNKMN